MIKQVMFDPDKLKKKMKQAGYQLYGGPMELAKDSGINYTTLHYLLKGERQPSIKTVNKIVGALNKKLEEPITLLDLTK